MYRKTTPAVTSQLRNALVEFQSEMDELTARFKGRPFTVGYAKATPLPARDGIAHGTIQRSSKAPNNSFFKHWTSEDDSITWAVDVGQAGHYDVIVNHTCARGDVGATIRLAMDGHPDFVEARVSEYYDPPLYDKSKERVKRSHYFVKNFKPLTLGRLPLPAGHGVVRLTAPHIVGNQAIDVHSIELIRSR